MKTKEQLETAVTFLLMSARKRKTEQGVLVYTKILNLLSSAKKNEEIDSIKKMLDHALNGIEAHGYLTKEEFETVRNLRETNHQT